MFEPVHGSAPDIAGQGPDSRAVLDFLIDLGKTHLHVALRGNHEIMMLYSSYPLRPFFMPNSMTGRRKPYRYQIRDRG
jgi:hypothetical protein